MRHCRHADVGERLTGRGDDRGLTDAGRDEAALLGDHLAGEPVTAIYASPRQRTRETAAMIAERHGLPVAIAMPLDEIDFGAWTGQRFADLDRQPDWDRWNRDRAGSRPPGGESMAEAVGRAAQFIERVDVPGTAIFVTHCDIIRGLLCRQDGRSFDTLFDYEVGTGAVVRYQQPGLKAAA